MGVTAPFGRHKGEPLHGLPETYLRWLHTWLLSLEDRHDWRWLTQAVEEELAARRAEDRSSQRAQPVQGTRPVSGRSGTNGDAAQWVREAAEQAITREADGVDLETCLDLITLGGWELVVLADFHGDEARMEAITRASAWLRDTTLRLLPVRARGGGKHRE